MDIVSSFTARLNELMKETGLTPKQISESTGIDLTELMHWKSDKNKKLPSTRNLLKLADFFRCSFAYMLGLENENSLPNPRQELPVFSERLCKILEKKQLKVFVLKRTGAFRACFYCKILKILIQKFGTCFISETIAKLLNKC